MRIHLTLSKNKELVDFNYQSKLVGCIHKWLGKNEIHGNQSLLSFSWLKNGKAKNNGLTFENGSRIFISAFDDGHLKKIINGIKSSPELFCGMTVQELFIENEPQFETIQKFKVDSPIFLKFREGDKTTFYYFDHPKSNALLTHNAKNKLTKAGLNSDGIELKFVSEYPDATIKGATYRGIFNKGSICPIVINGTPEQIRFMWNVGCGNSTGIGFGAISKYEL
jgi:CRISPR-associated endoribonuclease Cas6